MEQDRKAIEQKLIEENLRQKQEEDERQRKEMEEAIEMSKQLSREATLDRKRASLSAEPPADAQEALVRFQLPSGTKVARRFWKVDNIQVSIYR